MNEDINLRIKFIQEVERHPFLYDHNHVLYNHREKIEATWKKIGQIFGEGSDACKKKWRLIRCSYTRSLKTQKKSGPGIGLAKGYYMAPHLRFLDPFLKSRSYFDSNLSEEDEELDQVDSNSIVQVTLDDVKVEKEENVDEEIEEQIDDDDTSQGYLVDKVQHDGDDPTNHKKRRLQEETAKGDLSPNEMYLLSLAPYLDGMTERQKLSFQKGVVELIENIKYGS